ncbi:hypothetical protein VTK73DRAFT_7221 [Phialemonium thermophilum]|uniref:Uncharacterized protein n=1 Tax=Phialemonium thermophilum TaxID=223376 RepID=A0ABR3WG03_9PEZI
MLDPHATHVAMFAFPNLHGQKNLRWEPTPAAKRSESARPPAQKTSAPSTSSSASTPRPSEDHFSEKSPLLSKSARH